ncbi:hypothetical protein Indivirus_11_11 [Indivirus ILV1]|uniref:Uncharacterized protein n=1 Tax=Indivirus ILV1 TaxID=1977633 RepID=A0A1V0SEB9_9VIRU|nr:hypothetical protein Indivirus_11_11 [Indivirus ILV1]
MYTFLEHAFGTDFSGIVQHNHNIIQYPKEKHRRRLSWSDVNPEGLTGLLRDSPQSPLMIVTNSPTNLLERMQNAERFIKKLTNLNGKRTRIINILSTLLERYYMYVWVDIFDENFELCFRHKEIKNNIEINMSDDESIKLFNGRLIFSSFERGLKHDGLVVIKTTHGFNIIKKWGFQTSHKKAKSNF